ncbi:hypothetical protein GGR09_000843 [Bartonella heixiaziensis]
MITVWFKLYRSFLFSVEVYTTLYHDHTKRGLFILFGF